MREFISEDKFEIKGRGTVFTIACKTDIPRDEVFKQIVIIDGKTYVCKGIERFAAFLDNPLLHKGERVGLLVEEYDVEQAVLDNLANFGIHRPLTPGSGCFDMWGQEVMSDEDFREYLKKRSE